MLRLEALADAIGYSNQFHEPDSEAYQLRNPGLLRAWSLFQLGSSNDESVRRFETAQGGYKALCVALERRCERAKKASLHETINFIGAAKTDVVVDFLQRALKDTHITAKTPISFFME
jgi:hypothetical protein